MEDRRCRRYCAFAEIRTPLPSTSKSAYYNKVFLANRRGALSSTLRGIYPTRKGTPGAREKSALTEDSPHVGLGLLGDRRLLVEVYALLQCHQRRHDVGCGRSGERLVGVLPRQVQPGFHIYERPGLNLQIRGVGRCSPGGRLPTLGYFFGPSSVPSVGSCRQDEHEHKHGQRHGGFC